MFRFVKLLHSKWLVLSRNFQLGPQCLGVRKWSAVVRNDSGRVLVVLQILEKNCNSTFITYYSSILLDCLFLFHFSPMFSLWWNCCCVEFCWNGCVALCTPSVMSSLVGILKFTCLPCSFKKFESHCISLIYKLKQGLSFSQILSTETAASLHLPVLFFLLLQWGSEFWLEPAGISALLTKQLSKLFV